MLRSDVVRNLDRDQAGGGGYVFANVDAVLQAAPYEIISILPRERRRGQAGGMRKAAGRGMVERVTVNALGK